MRRKPPAVTLLELRKELLIAESEINRAHLLDEWQAMTSGVHTLAARFKSVSALASVAAVLVGGMSAFRRGKAVTTQAKPSWFQSALKAAEVAGSLWLAFRARQR
jgi:hypothetical protein